MMKKFVGFLVIALLLGLIIFVSINMKNNVKIVPSKYNDLVNIYGQNFKVVKADSKSLTYEITNNSVVALTYGADYSIEKLVKDEWYSYDVQIDFIEIAYLLEPGATKKEKIYFSSALGQLKPGKYRVIKNIDGNLQYAQFEIK